MSVPLTDEGVVLQGRFVPGEEQRFKRAVMGAQMGMHKGLRIFEIENEEKEPGFPDTLEIGDIGRRYRTRLVEYKVSDARGFITFKKTQPRFYRTYSELNIVVCAWSVPDQRGYYFGTDEIIGAVLAANAPKLSSTVRIYIGGGMTS